jgi:hypothetical protein
MLVKMMEDTEVPFGVRAKIAQDLLDRAGLIATQVHQIIPTTEDPIIRFFEDAFSDPKNWEENPPQPAIEEEPVIDADLEPEERGSFSAPNRGCLTTTSTEVRDGMTGLPRRSKKQISALSASLVRTSRLRG